MIACFIDAGYLDKVLQTQFNSARIDYAKLVEWMAGGKEILRTYYYNCHPYQSNPPTEDERKRFSNSESFVNNLRKLARFEIRLGKLEYRGTKQNGDKIFEQKRIDVMLGVDLTRLASKDKITHAAIFTGDSDFMPAISAAKDEGVLIQLFYGEKLQPHKDLWEHCDDRTAITEEVIQSILRK